MKIPFAALLLLLAVVAQSQITYEVKSFEPTPVAFKYLLWSNAEIEANDTINEQIIDLVEARMVDSILPRKREWHHLFFLGWAIHVQGYNWRAVSMTKEKFVGTVRWNGRSSEEEFTEYDINFDLNFHLRKYLHRAFDGYDAQGKIKRQDIRRSHRTNYDTIPFVRDTNHIDIRNYRLHCELTPPRAFRPQLHQLFYPTLPGPALKDHPNFGNNKPSMGFYGPFCLDCNHNCHPELHPYQWAWWMNLKDTSTTDKEWLIGMFMEGSNRFPKWGRGPVSGEIKIPFALQIFADQTPEIYIEHLVFNRFVDSLTEKLTATDSLSFAPDAAVKEVEFDSDNNTTSLRLHFNQALLSKGIQYSFSTLNLDRDAQVLSGYLHLYASVDVLYTTRIRFQSQSNE